MKLGICIPLYNVVPASFFANFISRIHELYTNGRYDTVKIYLKTSTVIDLARNLLVQDALADECTHILFLDSDILLQKGSIDKLVDMDVDIASGLYFAKGKPYLPVARLKSEDDRYFFLEDFDFGKQMEVAGVGMGCCLIKAEVFKNLEYPYFKFDWKKSGDVVYQEAEDLYFCRQATEKGYKVILNTGVVCGHFGTEVEGQHFMYYKAEVKRDYEEREELLDDLAAFEKLSKEEIIQKFVNAQKLREIEWKNYDFTKQEDVNKYYIENQNEIYDHFEWHFKGRRPFDKKLLEDIKRLYPDNGTEILDFGCGGGQLAYMLAKEKYLVTVADYNKKSLDFISYRFEKHRKKVKIIKLPVPEIRNKFDVICCFDVLEHVPDEEFDKTIDLLKSLKKPGARVFATVSFGAKDYHKTHFDMTEHKKKRIMELMEETSG